MLELSSQELRAEIAVLVTESGAEGESSQSAVSMLIEAQCLLAELIQDELNKVPLVALVPPDGLG
jgi:hypothetical protein